MIAEVKGKHQRKKRDAAYYREYRLRKKAESSKILKFQAATNHEPFAETVLSLPTSNSQTQPTKINFKNILSVLFISVLTGLLIHLSAPFYKQGHSEPMAYLMASLVELSILFLLSLQTAGKFDKFAKYFLIGALSSYALIPIILNPVNTAKIKLQEIKSQSLASEIKVKSIQSEITTRKQKAMLLQERGRITLAQSELQKVTELEEVLRNTVIQVQPPENATLQLQSSYAVAIQRMLLLLCNLFFVHQLVAQFKNSKFKKTKDYSAISFDRVCAT